MSPVDLPVDLLQSPAHSAIQAKLNALRSLMEVHRIDAYLVLSGDEHLNEYVPEAKQRRTWLSGFTGSAGDLLIGVEQAWVFVDSRYYEQAELQMQGTGIQVAKLGLEDQKTLVETLEAWGQEATQQQHTLRLGFDPFTLSIAQFQELQKQVEPNGVELVPLAENLVDQVRDRTPWSEQDIRPAYATSPVFPVPDAYTGESTAKKLDRVREAMQKSKIDILPLTKLDQIAWLFNLRGWDVSYNPVFIAYGIVTQERAFLFTNLDRIDESLRQSLSAIVAFYPYEAYGETLHSLVRQPQPVRVLLDPRQTTVGTRQLLIEARNTLGRRQVQLVEGTHPVEGLKARKNATEIDQMRAANLKASRAKTRTLKWIDDQVAAGVPLNERAIADTIERFYQEEAEFQGLSFNTIAATGANSSIVHYGTPSSKVWVQPGHLILLDSGAQYLGGTTDDTRTIGIGTPSAQQVERYTEVLKAHINCALQRFPKGTTGSQLDGITRANLWAIGLEYGHGTGHGVGAFLNVHEGPNGISKRVHEPLEPGMVTSVEPGFYEPGWGGIRIENLYTVIDLSTTHPPKISGGASQWYGLESLTFIPFDKKLIDCDRLDPRQLEWLKYYNSLIVEKLSPTLDPEEVQWLQTTCSL